MEVVNEYKGISNEVHTLHKDKGSKFIGFSYIVSNEQEVKAALKKLREDYADASHHCYGYVIGADRKIQRCSDDGEPKNSSGPPILRQILGSKATNVLIVSVRYFGGKKLGVSGLIEAYGESAKITLEASGFELKPITDTITFNFDIARSYLLYNLSERLKFELRTESENDQYEIKSDPRLTTEITNQLNKIGIFDLDVKKGK
jgi:uncharacterized YigZ family protein